MRLFSHCRSVIRSLCCLLICSLPVSLNNAIASDTPRQILIGYSGPLSGISEEFGKSLANAAEMALTDINRQMPRIAGHAVQFRLLRHDDRNDPDTAVRVARKLLDAGVVAVIGTANSATSHAVASLYENAGIPLISPAASATALTRPGLRGFFRLVGNDDDASAYLVEHAIVRMRIDRFAVIDDGGLFGQELARAVASQIERREAQVVMRVAIDFTDDLDELVRLARLNGAQALFFGGTSAQAAMLARAIAREGDGLRLLMASNGGMGTTFLIPAQGAANGTVAIESGLPLSLLPGGTLLEERYHSRYGLYFSGLAPFSYDTAHLLVAAMRQAGSTEPQQLLDMLYRMRYRGLTGAIAFDANGDVLKPVFTIYEVRNQRWVPLRIIGDRAALPTDIRRLTRALDEGGRRQQ